ncbi:MAG: acyl-CoA thioesterase [bacterium]|nr:acyl-CoA thioesterase [bacterium]
MKHEFKQRVYYADTDAYGVVWHGSYLRFMESARVEFCSELGINLVKLKKKDIVIPVTNINIRYKSSAVLDENIVVETVLSKLTPIIALFTQIIKNEETQQVHTTAEVEVVAVHNNGKIYRRLPDELKLKLEGALECKD